MAHHASAKQRIRRNERRTLINRNRVSRIRTHVKKVEQAIENGDRGDAVEAESNSRHREHVFGRFRGRDVRYRRCRMRGEAVHEARGAFEGVE